MGFESNIISKCVMNINNEKKLAIILYVDDILILWENENDAKWLVSRLREKFDSITEETSDEFKYLGMYVEMDWKGRYSIDIIVNTVNKSLGEVEQGKNSRIYAGKDPFKRYR